MALLSDESNCRLPVNSLVGARKFNNIAAQMTTHGDAKLQVIYAIVTLI